MIIYKMGDIDYSNYTLKPGLFSLCSGFTDKDGKQYNLLSKDIYNCCKNTYKSTIDYCQKTCKGEKCQLCNNIYNLSEEKCLLSIPNYFRTSDNPIIQCLSEYNCGNVRKLDRECMKKYKTEIINCCRKNCFPTRDKSCVGDCELIFDSLITNKAVLPHAHKGTYKGTVSSLYKPIPSKKDYSWIYLLVAVIISVVIFAILFKMVK